MNDSMPSKRGLSLWPIAITIIIVASLTAGYFYLDRVGPIFIDKEKKKTGIIKTVEKVRSEAKLVVYTFDVRVEIVKESTKSIGVWFTNFEVPRGTTRVSLRSSGNRVQCIVPLADISTNWFSVNEANKTVTVRVPKPVVDERLVEVQTDPRFVELRTSVGWARLDSQSGATLREEARKELREAVVVEGRSRLASDYQDPANRKAEEILQKLFEPLKSQLKDGVSFVVKFE